MTRFLAAGVALLALCGGAIAQVSTSQVAVVPNASAYSANQCIGGVLNVPLQVRVGGALEGAIVADVDIVDTSGTNATIDLFVFSQAPTGTYADSTPCTIAAADQPYLRGVVFGTSFSCAVDSAGTTGICRATPALSITQTGQQSNSLWYLPIVRTTPTYGASKKLYFNITAMPQ